MRAAFDIDKIKEFSFLGEKKVNRHASYNHCEKHTFYGYFLGKNYNTFTISNHYTCIHSLCAVCALLHSLAMTFYAIRFLLLILHLHTSKCNGALFILALSCCTGEADRAVLATCRANDIVFSTQNIRVVDIVHPFPTILSL